MQCFIFVGYVMQIEIDGDVVKIVVWERQFFGVGLYVMYIIDYVVVVQFIVVNIEYRVIDIG